MKKSYFKKILIFLVALVVGTGIMVLIPQAFSVMNVPELENDYLWRAACVVISLYIIYWSERLINLGTRARDAMDVAFFDKVYNKRGKVQIIPYIKKPTAQYLKKAPPSEQVQTAVKGHQGLPTQMTPGSSTEGHMGETSQHTQRNKQQSQQERKLTDSVKQKGEETQALELDIENFKSRGVLSHEKSDEAECDVLLKLKAALQNDMKQDHPPVFVLHNQFLGIGTKTGLSQETVQSDKSQQADKTGKSQEAVKTNESQEAVKTDESQKRVKTGKSQKKVKADKSQKSVKTDKSQEAVKTGQSKMEKDVLVLHPALGVLLLEVKSISPKEFDDYFVNGTSSVFDKATTQLLHAQKSIQEEMGDLLGKDAVILTIALPNLRPEDASVIREISEERMKQKQTSDVTEGTTSTEGKPVMTSVTGTAGQAAIASSVRDSGPDGNPSSPPPTAPPSSPFTKGSRKIEKFLVDHPEILLLCGSKDEVYGQWVKQLKERRASSGHAFQGISDEERENNFKRACIRRFSVAGLRPGQSVKDSAALHSRFLLSEEQLRVRDSQAQLLHICGPPGSGKTLLLAERARRWVSENKRVALAVGNSWHGALLHHLVCSVCGDSTDKDRVSAYRNYGDLLKWLDTVSTKDPVYVIMDEAWTVHYSSLLDHVTAGRVRGLWAASTHRLFDRVKEALQELRGTTEQLEISFRCPPSVITASNAVRDKILELPLQPPPVPLVRELGEGVVIISHRDHPQSQPWDKCPTCRKEVEAFFSSLGLPGDSATSALPLSDCVVITTDGGCDTEKVAAWLRGLGLHAMADKKPRKYDVTPVLLPGETPESRDEAEVAAWEARFATGTDRGGKPVLHVVDFADFRGLERALVMVWHEDWEDEDRDRQGQEDRDARMSRHRSSWFPAMTRSLAHVAVMATTNSPLLSKLPASSRTSGQVISSPSGSGAVSTKRSPSSSGAVSTELSPSSKRTPSDSTTPPDRARPHKSCTVL